MPKYNITGPDGQSYTVDAPEGATESQAQNYILNKYYAPPEDEETAGFFEGLQSGTKRFLSGIQTGVEAPFTSGEEAAISGIERGKNITGAPGTSLKNVTSRIDRGEYLGAVGEALSQVPGALGEQTPVLASIFGGTKLGTAIATGFARGLALPLPPHLRIAAGLIGGMAAPFFSMAGSNMERKAEEDIKAGRPVDVDELSAYSTALAQSAIERAGLAYSGISKVLGFSLVKGGTKAAEKLARENIASALAKGAGKLAVVEGATEATQQLLERYYAGLPLTDEDAQKEYMESAYAAALLFPLGSYQRASERSGAKQEIRQENIKKAKEKLKKTQEEEEQKEKDADKSINEEINDIERQANAELAGDVDLGDIFTVDDMNRAKFRSRDTARNNLLKLDLTKITELQQADEILTEALRTYDDARVNKKVIKKLRTKVRKRIKELETTGDAPPPPAEETDVVVVSEKKEDEEKEVVEEKDIVVENKKKDDEKIVTDVGEEIISADDDVINIVDDKVVEETAVETTDVIENEEEVLNFIANTDNVTKNKIVTQLNVTQSEATKILKKALDDGVIKADTKGTSTIYTGVQDDRRTGKRGRGAAQDVDQRGLGVGVDPSVQQAKASDDIAEEVTKNDRDAVATLGSDTGQLTGRKKRVDSPLIPTKQADVLRKKPGVKTTGKIQKNFVGKTVTLAQIDPDIQGGFTLRTGEYINKEGTPVLRTRDRNFKPKQKQQGIEESAPGLVSEFVINDNAIINPNSQQFTKLKKLAKTAREKNTKTNVFFEGQVTNSKGLIESFQNELKQIRAIEAGDITGGFVDNALSPVRNTALRRLTQLKANARKALADPEFKKDINKESNKSLKNLLFSRRPGIEQDKEVIKGLKGVQNLGEALTTIEKKFGDSLSTVQKQLLPIIMGTPRTNQTSFKISPKMEQKEGGYGSYELKTDTIKISDNADLETIFHEGTHAATANEVSNHVNEDGVGITRIGKRLVELYNDAKRADVDNEFSIELENVDEFVTNALNNGQFQEYLSSIPASESNFKAPPPPPTGQDAIQEENSYIRDLERKGATEQEIIGLVRIRRAGNNTVWSKFVNTIKDMFRANDTPHNVLNDVLAISPSLFFGPNAEQQIGSDKILYNKNESYTDEELKEVNERLKQPSEVAADQEDKIKKEIGDSDSLVSIWDKIATSVFSFDAALNNKVRRELEKDQDTDWEVISKTLNEMSVSQVLHVENVVEEFLKFGKIKYNTDTDKFVVVDEGNASFQRVMDSLKELAAKANVQYQTMREAADKNFKARRAQELINNNNIIKAQMKALFKQGKKQQAKDLGKANLVKVLLTQDQIDEALTLSKTYPELNDIHNMWIESKNDAIQFLVDTEIMTPEQAKEFSMVVDTEGAPEQMIEKDENGNYLDTYVPFYGKNTKKKPSARQKTRLGDRGKFYRLKGTYEPVDDVFTNMELWMRSSLKRGMLNKKALDKIKAIESLPQQVQNTIMKTGKDVDRGSANTVAMSRVRDGVRRVEYYEFSDPFFAQAFSGMERAQIDGLGFITNISNFLRSNVVLYPLFSLAQLPQDSVSAMFSSGVKNPFMIPLRVLKEFPKTLLNMSQTHKDMKKYGAVGFAGTYSQADVDAKGEIMDDGFYNRWSSSIRANPVGDAALTFLNRIAMASDNAVRQAVYEQTMKETGNERLAIERAFEVINFKRAGSNAAVTMLRQTVPFFGAYLQAASVQGRVLTGRGITPTQRAQGMQQLLLTGTQLAMLTLAYTLMADDDEDSEYEKLDPTIRDRRFLLGNGAYITLRPDLFTFLFKIMPEQVINTMNEEQDNKKTFDSMKRNLGEIFNANIVPQAVRPIANVLSNRDARTGRPIIPQSIADLEKRDQYTANTSELAKILSDMTGNVRPTAEYDYYLRQYLGYTGGLLMMFADKIIDDLDVYDYDRATKSDRDLLASIPGMSNFIAREYGNRHTTDYYEAKAEISKIYNSYKNLEKNEFDRKRVEDYAKDNYVVIQAKGEINAKVKALQGIREERRRLIEAPRTVISADGKKELLDAFYAEERELLREIREFRKIVFGTGFEDSPETIR
tara:strand:- start:371 stop:6577 length:6207 start_codon:yes stop_codon:yes gene_type:complete